MANRNRNGRFAKLAGMLGAALAGAIIMGVVMVTVRPFDPSEEVASIARGKALAVLVCSGCHEVGPTGNSRNPQATPFHGMLAKLTLEGLADEISEGLPMGHKPMPRWNFSQEQAADLINYISSLKQGS